MWSVVHEREPGSISGFLTELKRQRLEFRKVEMVRGDVAQLQGERHNAKANKQTKTTQLTPSDNSKKTPEI